MREIKFRFYDPFNGTYHYSDSYDDLSNFFLAYHAAKEGGNNPIFEQLTGFKDKNGVDIYEGDILQVTANPHHGRGLVCFGLYRLENFTKHDRQKDHLGFHILYGKECLSLAHSQRTPSGYQSSTHSLEIIGNIHQHPELLEGN